MPDSGYPEDDAYPGKYEWWRHRATRIVVAVRLNNDDEVTGAVRPIRESELNGPAKGFVWEDASSLRNHVRKHRPEFDAIGDQAQRPIQAQQPEVHSDLEALGWSLR